MKKASFIILALLIVSCAPGGLISPNPDDREYFVGTEGVSMRFAPDSPPREKIIGFEEEGVEDNEFFVDIFVKNQGASLSRGGIYLSGYDPTIIEFEDMKKNQGFFDDCRFGFPTGDETDFSLSGLGHKPWDFGHGQYSAIFQCKRFGLSVIKFGDGFNPLEDLGIILNLNDIFQGSIPIIRDIPFLDQFSESIDLKFVLGPSGFRLDTTFNDPDYDATLGFHGPLFLTMLSKYNFTLNGGREFFLPGDNPRFPGDKEALITFKGEVTDELPPGFDKSQQTIMATSCYLYTTYASPTICVDVSPYSDNEKVCGPTRIKYDKGQGGPVAVTRIKQINTGYEIIVEFDVENVGGGTVYNPFSMSSCVPYNPLPAIFEDQNLVVIGSIFIGDENSRMGCVPFSDVIYLYSGKGTASCAYKFPRDRIFSQSGFEAPLVIELWYGYSESIKTKMTVDLWGRKPYRSVNTGFG